jgi:predicted Zn-dependent protease
MGFQSYRRQWRRRSPLILLTVCLVLVLHLTSVSAGAVAGEDGTPANSTPVEPSRSTAPQDHLPPLRVHPLPDTLFSAVPSPNVSTHGLTDVPASNGETDYFDAVQPTPLGYLIWSQFPVRVYLDAAIAPDLQSESSLRLADTWRTAVTAAVAEWNSYLPLEIVSDADAADITVVRRSPPLDFRPGQPLRARAAETRYEFYADTTVQPPRLSHRFQVFLRSDQSAEHVQATARHELGHALGIWGHSPLETDALYFSHVRHPPAISARDVATLRRIYQQPTRLGWPFF